MRFVWRIYYLDVNTVMYNDKMDVTDHILINYDE